jgi:enoyl-CoA hydratase/carnithine racemase
MSLRIQQDGRLCHITLAAPEKRNVLDLAMSAAIATALKDATADSATGAILLDADGPVFCAGSESHGNEDLYTLSRHLTKPLVIAAKGAALAGGAALVASAHVAIAAQGTSFGLTDMREGRWSEDIYRAVAEAIGKRRAMELSLTGRVFSTPDALAWGLIHMMTPAFELDDRAEAVAMALANANEDAIRRALAS